MEKLSSYYVIAGSVPTLNNLPDTVDIRDSEPVDSVIFTLSYSDLNTMDVLTVSLAATQPATTKFAVNSTTGISYHLLHYLLNY